MTYLYNYHKNNFISSLPTLMARLTFSSIVLALFFYNTQVIKESDSLCPVSDFTEVVLVYYHAK